MASAQNEEQLRAWERARALGNLGVLSNDDDHRHARSNARAVNPDDARVVDARHHSPPPQPRRTHGTPGSYSSPETTHNSQQLIEDLSEVISSPTRADRPVRGEPSSHQVNRQILAGIEDSFEDIDPPEEHSSLGRQHKRNSDMFDRDGSWVLQQSHESAPDANLMANIRRAIRTSDNTMHDDMQRSPSNYYEHHPTRQEAAQDMDYDVHYEHQRQHVGVSIHQTQDQHQHVGVSMEDEASLATQRQHVESQSIRHMHAEQVKEFNTLQRSDLAHHRRNHILHQPQGTIHEEASLPDRTPQSDSNRVHPSRNELQLGKPISKGPTRRPRGDRRFTT
jgi:hypothetical protein